MLLKDKIKLSSLTLFVDLGFYSIIIELTSPDFHN